MVILPITPKLMKITVIYFLYHAKYTHIRKDKKHTKGMPPMRARKVVIVLR